MYQPAAAKALADRHRVPTRSPSRVRTPARRRSRTRLHPPEVWGIGSERTVMNSTHWIALSAVLVCPAAEASIVTAQSPRFVGSYWCSRVEASETVFAPSQRCTIRRTPAGALAFEKLGGSERFSGTLLPSDDGGFRFVGIFFCPTGACDEVVDTQFTPIDGGWKSELRPQYHVTVTRVRPAQPHARAVFLGVVPTERPTAH